MNADLVRRHKAGEISYHCARDVPSSHDRCTGYTTTSIGLDWRRVICQCDCHQSALPAAPDAATNPNVGLPV